MNYEVIYKIEIEAESHREAALEVEGWMKDNGCRPVFDVTDSNGKKENIDLEVETVEDTNKHVKALCHDISYFFRDTELDIDSCGVEHIEYQIGQGYIEGELTVTDPDNPEESYYGYWHIVK